MPEPAIAYRQRGPSRMAPRGVRRLPGVSLPRWCPGDARPRGGCPL